MNDDLNNEYFDWLYQIVCDERYSGVLFRNLLWRLHSIDFYYTIPMDGNRFEDGIDLRYRFGHAKRYSQSMISSYLDNRPCSVLEMMIALAIRCEENIMDDPDLGDRTSQWFWNMISSMHLDCMDDLNFDLEYVDEAVYRMMDHRYSANGEGGLFTLKYNRNRDMRNADIWYQMNYYLDEIL